MPHERDLGALADVPQAARLILAHIEGFDLGAFAADVKTQDAVVRRFQILGEATRRISEDFRKQYPEVPWAEMRGMRNVVVHQYDEAVVWKSATEDIPALIAQIERILE